MLSKRALLLFIILCIVGSNFALAGDSNNKDRLLPVMTRNMDAGSDFGFLVTEPLEQAVPDTFNEMLFSGMAARANGLAQEILAKQPYPYLIGLQEITVLTVADSEGNQQPVVDQLQLLMAALEQGGGHYTVVQRQTNLAIPFGPVGFADSDAVLARTDLPVSQLKIEGVQAAHFAAAFPFTVPGISVSVPRGWIAVDAKLRGKPFRFVTTHLESFDQSPVTPEPYRGIFQGGQALELLSGPLSTDMPVILAGDLNSGPFTFDPAVTPFSPVGPAYNLLIQAGLTDSWTVTHPNVSAFTWPLFLEDSPRPSSPSQRIDVILTAGKGIESTSEVITGLSPIQPASEAPPVGLWTSDHAGVIATFTLLP